MPLIAQPLVSTPRLRAEDAARADQVPSRDQVWKRLGNRVLVILFIALVAWIAIVQGMNLRSRLWLGTTAIRFKADIGNAWNQGMQIVAPDKSPKTQPSWKEFWQNYLNRYPELAAKHEADQKYGLDYTPMRLLVMSMWVKHVHWYYPNATEPKDAYIEPLLRLNAACGLAAAVFAFALVRLWVKRGQEGAMLAMPAAAPGKWRKYWDVGVRCLVASIVIAANPALFIEPLAWLAWPTWMVPFLMAAAFVIFRGPEHRPWMRGLLAALLVWFNAAVLVDAHTWPQWDVWIVPFFLLAALLCSVDAWFWAGATLAVGCMFKGQLALAGPVLLLWPLFAGRFISFGRAILGVGFGTALAVWPWLVRDVNALFFVATLVASTTILIVWARIGRLNWKLGVAMTLLAASLVFLPHALHGWYRLSVAALVIAVALLGWPRLIGKGAGANVFALALVAAVFVAGVKFNGSFAWYSVGFAYATDHYKAMVMGPVSNLPAILSQPPYQWKLYDTVGLPNAPGWIWTLAYVQLFARIVVAGCFVPLALVAMNRTRWTIGKIAWGIVPAIVLLLVSWPGLYERFIPWGGNGFGWPVTMSFQWLTRTIYIIALVLCAIGAGMHARRKSPRVMLAIVAPWIVMFAVLAQMHERYLMWGAVLSAIGVGVSLGMTLMHLVVTSLSTAIICTTMFGASATYAPKWLNFLRKAQPGLGWAVLLCAGIYLFMALAPDRRGKKWRIVTKPRVLRGNIPAADGGGFTTGVVGVG